ncbi:hypothetical protein [Phocaeicola oris]|nr:hypothetical protein [Phocaeicola oris]MCE2616974.1 hypothetical protein [Phocaeicola oris]
MIGKKDTLLKIKSSLHYFRKTYPEPGKVYCKVKKDEGMPKLNTVKINF